MESDRVWIILHTLSKRSSLGCDFLVVWGWWCNSLYTRSLPRDSKCVIVPNIEVRSAYLANQHYCFYSWVTRERKYYLYVTIPKRSVTTLKDTKFEPSRSESQVYLSIDPTRILLIHVHGSAHVPVIRAPDSCGGPNSRLEHLFETQTASSGSCQNPSEWPGASTQSWMLYWRVRH